MPALPNANSVLKVQLDWGVEGDSKAETVHHVAYTGGPPTAANCVTMANSMLAETNTAFDPLINDSSGCLAVKVTDLTSPTSAVGVSTGAAGTGTRGTTLLPPGTAALVNHQILRRYRGGHPRTYFPFGISSDVATTGLWAGAFVTAVNTAYTTWAAAILGEGAGCALSTFVNLSYYSGFTVVTNPITGRSRNVPKVRAAVLIDLITGSSCATKIGSQRRRNKDA